MKKKLYDIITHEERRILREHHGATLEARTIRARLHEHGLRFCRGCDRVKPLTAFASHARSYRMPAGYQARCMRCGRARWRKGNQLAARAPYVKPSLELQKQRQRRSVRRWHLLTQQEKLDIRADIPMRKKSVFYAPVHHKFGDVAPNRVP